MANITEILDQIEKWRGLLRENRATEVDTQMDALRTQVTEQLAAEKAAAPPPSPLTTEQLILAAFTEIAARFGNDARLLAILTELRPKLSPPPE